MPDLFARTSLRQHFSQLGQAMRIVWRSGPGWTLSSIALAVVLGVLPLIPLYLTKLVVDALVTGLSGSAVPVGDLLAKLNGLILGMIAVSLLIAILRAAAKVVNNTQVQVVTDYVFHLIHTKSVELDLEYYENAAYQDTLHRAQQQAASKPPQIVNNLLRLAQSSISLLAIIGLLASFNWVLTALLFVAALPGLLLSFRYSARMYQWQKQRTALQRKAGYYNILLIHPFSAKEVRLFGLGTLLAERFKDMRDTLRREQLGISIRQAFADLLIQGLATVVVLGAYAFIVYQVVLKQVTLGDLVLYYQFFQRGQSYLQDVVSSISDLYENSLFVSSLREFLDLKPKIAIVQPDPPALRSIRQGIVFENVSFQYPGSDREALKFIDWTIRPGQVVALVGENGSGKSTLVKLLCRLYDPSRGRITLDGLDIREYDVADYRRLIGVVFQDYMTYQLTARENIWFGDVDLNADDPAIQAAARLAGIDGVVSGLPGGYRSQLGKLFEGGTELSAGQWQKIALARAFLRQGPLVILDEPSSGLDPQAEADLFNGFREVIRGKAAVLVSHRLSTVRMADCISVFDHGTIIEQGSHDELMAAGRKYAALFQAQAQHYL